MIHDLLAELGGRKFVAAAFGCFLLYNRGRFQIDDQLSNQIMYIVIAFVIGQSAADGLSKGATSSVTGLAAKGGVGPIGKTIKAVLSAGQSVTPAVKPAALIALIAIPLLALSGCGSSKAAQQQISQAKLEITHARDNNSAISNAFADDWRATKRDQIDKAYESGINAASMSPDGGKTMVIDSRQMLAIQKVRDQEYAKVDAVWQANKGKILAANVDLIHAAARMDEMLNYLTNQQSTSDLANASTDALLKLLQQYITSTPAPAVTSPPPVGK